MSTFIKKSEIPNKQSNDEPQALNKIRKSQTQKQ
jgi:hypothetical protein